ncbi:MAG: RagB/SusD family nutrient uptake outer membrane protein, partial [Bacteroidales bacterium]|nr:RagB/SusD family nutrient uptake outer membrane protein [Bacteroidales bacterium]
RWKNINDLNEQPKGWNIMGENNDDFYQVIHVHPRKVSFSTKDYFFPIKESNLYVNDRLIQNYGW